MKKGIVLLLLVFCIVSLCSCNTTEQYFVYGNIPLEITASGIGSKKLSDNIAEYIDTLELIFSPTVEGSDIYNINTSLEGERVKCCDETMQALRIAEQVYLLSDGAYDPSIYPLVRLWNFSGDLFDITRDKNPPSEDAIENGKSLVGLSKAFVIDYENNEVTKNVGYGDAMLDLGGVAKGYAVDNARKHVGEKQKALVNLGGNITAANNSYVIGIKNPRASDTPYFGRFTLNSGECISTSGDYERYFDYSGVRYHHIIDPKTGSPCDSGLISVSVISNDGALGDAVSTAVMVLGKDKGVDLLNALSIKAVLVDSAMNYIVVGNLDFEKR